MCRRAATQRGLTAPWRRAVAIAAAWLLALNALGLPVLTAPQPASCCCQHQTGDPGCPCRICTHARELASNRPILKTCPMAANTATPVTPDPAFARPMFRASRATPPRLDVDVPLACAPPDPICEVPTPPPLARS
jgi:hypothetical protein